MPFGYSAVASFTSLVLFHLLLRFVLQGFFVLCHTENMELREHELFSFSFSASLSPVRQKTKQNKNKAREAIVEQGV